MLFAAGMLGGCGAGDAEYVIRRVGADMKVDGDVNKSQWQSAQEIRIEQVFLEYAEGRQSPTTAKAVYNEEALFLLFVSNDDRIEATHTEPNSMVSKDDCVEFFAVPRPGESNDYFNLEINCVGAVLLRYGPECKTWDEVRAKPLAIVEQIGRLEIYHSVPGPTKQAGPDDREWIIECKVPFEMLRELAGVEQPGSGTVWRANFYRCGDMVGEAAVSWQRLDENGLGFHQPRKFAPMAFE